MIAVWYTRMVPTGRTYSGVAVVIQRLLLHRHGWKSVGTMTYTLTHVAVAWIVDITHRSSGGDLHASVVLGLLAEMVAFSLPATMILLATTLAPAPTDFISDI